MKMRITPSFSLLAFAFAALTGVADAQLTTPQREKLLDDGGFTKIKLEKSRTPSATTTAAAAAHEAEKIKNAGAALDKGVSSLEQKLTGFGFGAGVAVLFLNGDRPVESASVDASNVVRIDSKSKMRTGTIFETHWLFSELPFTKPESPETSSNKRTAGQTILNLRHTENYDQRGVRKAGVTEPTALRSHKSWGPVFTAELGDNTIRSLGIGLMFALQHYEITSEGAVNPRGAAFNVGVVAFAEPNVKRVTGAFVDGQVVPAGTTIKVQEEHRFGYGLVFSTRF